MWVWNLELAKKRRKLVEVVENGTLKKTFEPKRRK